jgi:ubiquitin C-terminal hydrolase
MLEDEWEDETEEVMVKRDGIKRMVFHDLPQVLTVHLKRFRVTMAGRGEKIDKKVETPLVLDMAPYCSVASGGRSSDRSSSSSTVYDLVGLISHSGTMSFGHYIAIVKGMEEKEEKEEKEKEEEETNEEKKEEKKEERVVDQKVENEQKGKEEKDLRATQKEDEEKDQQGVEDKNVQEILTESPNESPNETQKKEQSPSPGRWFYISDSSVREVTEASALQQQAFILFYARR